MVFDLDGTLLDSSHAMKAAFDKAYRLAVPDAVDVPFHEVLVRQGMPFPDIVQNMGWPTSLPRIFKAESIKMASEVSMFPGVRRVLEFLLESVSTSCFDWQGQVQDGRFAGAILPWCLVQGSGLW